MASLCIFFGYLFHNPWTLLVSLAVEHKREVPEKLD